MRIMAVDQLQGQARKVELGSASSKVQPWPAWMGVKTEKIITPASFDLSSFADYRTVHLPVQYGPRTGHVYAFSHKDHLDERFDKLYKECLRNAIEVKKYIESQKAGYDVGPAIAVASLIEDGDYARHLKLFETDDVALRGFEHVLFVKENGHSYHLLPAEYECAFGNTEQVGLIRISIALAFGGDLDSLPKEVQNEKAKEWIMSDNERNCRIFRRILNESRIFRLEGSEREFSNCIIHENVLGRIRREFALQQILDQFWPPEESEY